MAWQRKVAHNARWYLAEAGTASKVGWGDLSLHDLQEISHHLTASRALLVVPEVPLRPMTTPLVPIEEVWEAEAEWGGYDRPDPTPRRSVEALVDIASFAIFRGEVLLVDRYAMANRLGAVWIQAGHRRARNGRRLPTAEVRFMTIKPKQLLERLLGGKR